ncbi:MAG: hypothetical protein Q8R78_05065 [Candidatus Omnitrophota bacterium]|nr:hypothetical protein [Candidatus Omnitrophota bacterium]
MSNRGRFADTVRRNPLGALVVGVIVVMAAVAVAKTLPSGDGRSRRGQAGSFAAASQLIRAIDTLPILEQEEASRSYLNARVTWPVVVEEILRTEGERRGSVFYELQGRDPRNEKIAVIAVGFGNTDVPALKRIRRRQSTRITGRIQELDRTTVVLTDAQFASKAP